MTILPSKLTIFGDGGSRGNPGEAAYGFVVYDDQNILIYKEGKRLGITTNNVAEYSSVVNALRWVLDNRPQTTEIYFYLDSLLVASQMAGKYKVKHPNMKPLYIKAKDLEEKLSCKVHYNQVPRAQNKIADGMVNDALDNLI